MSRSDNVTSYLMRITQVRDQLAAIGEKTEDAELMNVALNGLPKSWEPFVKGVCARENIPDWQRLWDDCIQEETLYFMSNSTLTSLKSKSWNFVT
jgi:hypothetical protein